MKAIIDQVVPGRGGGAWTVKKLQHIRITDLQGGAIGDFVCFNAGNLKERFSQARTKANQGKLLITRGDHLYTRDNNILLTIVEDTYGIHDLQYGMCSAWVVKNFNEKNYQGWGPEMRVGGPLGTPSFGCYEVLQKALKDFPIAPEDIPEPFNLFQTNDYKPDFTFNLSIGKTRPGDYIEFVAQTDTLCALSACPAMGRPLQVQVFAN
jgi:uncharacterized protein